MEVNYKDSSGVFNYNKYTTDKLDEACQLLFGDNKPTSTQLPSIEEAIKILNTAVQRNENLKGKPYAWDRKKIENLNEKLKKNSLGGDFEKKGFDKNKIGNLKNLQVDLPPSWVSRVTFVPRLLWTALTELMLLPVAGVLCLIAKKNFDPKQVDKSQPPILLVHGCGYNQAEWVLFRHQLQQKGHTSIYSLNMDENIVFPTKTEEEYTQKVEKKIDKIIEETGYQKVILIGHSLGGVVAAHAAQSGKVKAVISIASPFKGARLLNFLEKYLEPITKYFGRALTAVERQLKKKSNTLKEIREKAKELDEKDACKFYNIRSTMDEMVDGRSAFIVSDPRRQVTLDSVGHYGIIASPKTLNAVDQWLKEIKNSSSHENAVDQRLKEIKNPFSHEME